MSNKIAQTMETLAEENRDMKISLKLLLKYEIQSLLERLSALGDDSLLIISNSNEGTCSHLGTQNADNFLQTLQSQYCLNLKDTFQKFCYNSAGMSGQYNSNSQQQPMDSQSQGQSMQQQQQQQQQQGHPVPLMNVHTQLQNLQGMLTNAQQRPGPMMSNRFSPYNNNMHGNYQQPGNMNAGRGDNGLNPALKDRKKRNACRHFLHKGYCWQGSTCAFLHTRDPQVVGNKGDGTQSPSSSSIENQSNIEQSQNEEK